MDYNLLENVQYCKDIVDGLLSFLYYTHIPPAVISLLLGGYVFFKNKASISARWLLALSVTFAVWTMVDLTIWLTYDRSAPMMFLWSTIPLLSSLLFIFTLFFVFSFVTGRTIPRWMTFTVTLLLFPVIALMGTNWNLEGFDVANCVAIEHAPYLYYYHLLGLVCAIALPFTLFAKRSEQNLIPPKVAIPAILGAELFILTFLITGFAASYFVEAGLVSDFGIEQYGIMAMAVFMGFLGYLMVQYHAFNLKVLGANVLMFALTILVLSEYLFIENETAFWLVTLTAVIVVFFGFMLVGNVKKEVKQREDIERLAKNLESTNQQLEQANDRLHELDQMKSEFLSIASHQLRAPITAVRGYAANINEGEYGKVPKNLKEPLETVQESARLMAQSIEDYLNISRIEQGRMKFEKSDFDLADLAQKVVRELTPVAEKKKLKLIASVPQDLVINADVGKMKQVLTNLIDNAIKYTPTGSVTVSVEKKDAAARLTITDTGVGIAPEEIGLLFEKFKRARGANKVNTTGTGLGLYVAKQLAEGNGGKIWVESDGAGKGSRFIVELPAK